MSAKTSIVRGGNSMSIKLKIGDQITRLATALFEYDNETRTHKLIVKTLNGKTLRMVAPDKEPLKLQVLEAIKNTVLTSITKGNHKIDLTELITHAESFYAQSGKQGYYEDIETDPTAIKPETQKSLVYISENKTPTKSQLYIHILEGKTAVKVNQYNLSSHGNVFNIVFSNQNLTLASNNSIPVLKFVIDPEEIEILLYKHKTIDNIRKHFDKIVKQVTQDILTKMTHNAIITPQHLLQHYQQHLPRFTHESVVHAKQV